MRGDYQVFLGLDVGKDGHHTVALNRDGKRLHDAALVNTEAKLRQVFDKLAKHGPALMIVDLQPGAAKTDARDAYVIADAARTPPHTLRRIDVGDEALAKLEVLVGFDDDLAGKATRLTNRIRGLLTQIHPALDEQTVIVPGTAAAETILPQLADTLRDVLQQRDQVAAEVDSMLDAHPLPEVLTSIPGIGVRTAARILLEVSDGSAFATPGHLAAYAGLAPLTRRSDNSIRGGNKQLKRAFFLAAFAALADPTSRAYYDRKPAQGKRHNAALICLARRRCNILFAMLRGLLHQWVTSELACLVGGLEGCRCAQALSP